MWFFHEISNRIYKHYPVPIVGSDVVENEFGSRANMAFSILQSLAMASDGLAPELRALRHICKDEVGDQGKQASINHLRNSTGNASYDCIGSRFLRVFCMLVAPRLALCRLFMSLWTRAFPMSLKVKNNVASS